jgi:hypothetical protein
MTEHRDGLVHSQAVADELRTVWPEKAAEIERAIAQARAGQSDGVKVNVGIRFKLEKFEGEMSPGKAPVEVIEGKG